MRSHLHRLRAMRRARSHRRRPPRRRGGLWKGRPRAWSRGKTPRRTEAARSLSSSLTRAAAPASVERGDLAKVAQGVGQPNTQCPVDTVDAEGRQRASTEEHRQREELRISLRGTLVDLQSRNQSPPTAAASEFTATKAPPELPAVWGCPSVHGLHPHLRAKLRVDGLILKVDRS